MEKIAKGGLRVKRGRKNLLSSTLGKEKQGGSKGNAKRDAMGTGTRGDEDIKIKKLSRVKVRVSGRKRKASIRTLTDPQIRRLRGE